MMSFKRYFCNIYWILLLFMLLLSGANNTILPKHQSLQTNCISMIFCIVSYKIRFFPAGLKKLIICCFIPLYLQLHLGIVTFPSLLFIYTLMTDILLFPWNPARFKKMLSSNALETVRLQHFHHVKSLKCSSHWILIPCML